MLFYKYMQVRRLGTMPAWSTLSHYILMKGKIKKQRWACSNLGSSFLSLINVSVFVVFFSAFAPETKISHSVEGYWGHPWKQLCVHWPHPATVRSSVGVSKKQLTFWWASSTPCTGASQYLLFLTLKCTCCCLCGKSLWEKMDAFKRVFVSVIDEIMKPNSALSMTSSLQLVLHWSTDTLFSFNMDTEFRI